MDSTFHYEDGGAIVVGPGATREDVSCMLRLEVYGLPHNGGSVAFLDARAREWLRRRLDAWDLLDPTCPTIRDVWTALGQLNFQRTGTSLKSEKLDPDSVDVAGRAPLTG